MFASNSNISDEHWWKLSQLSPSHHSSTIDTGNFSDRTCHHYVKKTDAIDYY